MYNKSKVFTNAKNHMKAGMNRSEAFRQAWKNEQIKVRFSLDEMAKPVTVSAPTTTNEEPCSGSSHRLQPNAQKGRCGMMEYCDCIISPLIPQLNNLNSVLEIVRIKQVTMIREEDYLYTPIKTASDVAEIIYNEIGEDDREVFLVLALNSKNHVNAIHRCSIGSLNRAFIHPREVFKAPILNNSQSIIVAHNILVAILLPL